MATPMRGGVAPDAAVDFGRLAKLVDFHIANRTDGLVAVGTTGESATLDEAEHCEVIRFIVERANGRVPVIGGTGANSTLEAIRLTECAREAGVDACLLVSPYYNKPTQEGLYHHHVAVAEAVDIPQILYNVPGRTVCDMLPETISRLATTRNIIGVKEATGDVSRIAPIRASCPDDFLIYSGDDATSLDLMLAGGDGVISVTANIAPALMHDMCAAALAGDEIRARELDARLAGLHAALFCESNPIPTKWALQQMGLAEEGIRLPLTWMDKAHAGTVLAAMQQAGVATA